MTLLGPGSCGPGCAKVLMTGGVVLDGNSKKSQVFDPGTGTWATTEMGQGRLRHTATLLPDTKVLVAGGGSGQQAELYDPSSNSWSPTADMAQTVDSASATLLRGTSLQCGTSCDKVLVAGGGIKDLSKPNELPTPTALSQLYVPGSSG